MGTLVAVAQNALPNFEELTTRFSGSVEFITGPIDEPAQVTELTRDADALVVGLHRLTDDHFASLSGSVKIVGRTGVGLDTIDLQSAERRGVAVVYQPSYATAEVATHAVAMLLALQRRLFSADAVVRSGWGNIVDVGRVWALDEATVAVLGCGRIGRIVIDRLRPFVKEIRVYDPFLTEPIDGASKVSGLDELLDGADALSLHLPLTEETRHIIGRRELYAMRRGSIVVNVSRGGLIDEDELASALRDGQLSGAGIDVFEQEPLPLSSPLRSVQSALLTPHMAWYTDSALSRLSEWTVNDVLAFLTRGQIEHGRLAVGPAESVATKGH